MPEHARGGGSSVDPDATRPEPETQHLPREVGPYRLLHRVGSAGPPSTLYRAKKFVRRHRVGVTAAAALFLLLVAFSVTVAMQARRIALQRDRAERVSSFLVSFFEASDPDRSKGDRL